MSWRSSEWQQPTRLQIDYDQLVWQALLNCANSFQGLETRSMMEQGVSMMASQVSLERWTYNVRQLSNYILPKWEDDEYKRESEEKDPFKLHRSIIRLLNRRNFFKQKEELETIRGQLPKSILDLLPGRSKDSEREKTASSS